MVGSKSGTYNNLKLSIFLTLFYIIFLFCHLTRAGTINSDQRSVVDQVVGALISDQENRKGEERRFELLLHKKSAICTIMYTSGTTGEPKGVLITNENIVSMVTGIGYFLKCQNEELTEKDVYLSFLPLAHIFDRVIEEFFISKSVSIGFWHGDVKLLVEDIVELKPTVFCGVPHVFDRIYSGPICKSMVSK